MSREMQTTRGKGVITRVLGRAYLGMNAGCKGMPCMNITFLLQQLLCPDQDKKAYPYRSVHMYVLYYLYSNYPLLLANIEYLCRVARFGRQEDILPEHLG